MSALFSTYDAMQDGKRDGKITTAEMQLGFDSLTNSTSTDMDTKLRTEYKRLFGNDEETKK